MPAARLRDLCGDLPGAGASDPGGPLYRQLIGRIRLLILDGQLSDGVRLPSERDLGQALGVSRSTITSTYAGLRQLGLLAAHRGSGNYVR
jgi:DNA-binding GntR family transcriptional regulator